MIYLDNASTTKPIIDRVQLENIFCNFFNPSSNYAKNEQEILLQSRSKIAKILEINSNDIYFTSCATEANNWVINKAVKNKKNTNIVISSLEHPSIYNTAKRMSDVEVRIVEPKTNKNRIEPTDVLECVDSNTRLVSIVNLCSVTGNINDVYNISKAVKQKNPRTIFHTDAVQSFCKIDIDSTYIDLITISGHKVGGIKGAGALYINPKINLAPYLTGGEQENNLRAGTENLPAIYAFSLACENFRQNYDIIKMSNIYDIINNRINNKVLLTEDKNSNILCLCIEDVKAEILQSMLAEEEIYIGIGSACSGVNTRYFARKNLSKSFLDGIIRISSSIDTTIDEVEFAVSKINEISQKIRNKKIYSL